MARLLNTLTDDKDEQSPVSGPFASLIPIPPVGRSLAAIGMVRQHVSDFLVMEVQIYDADGQPILVGQGTILLRDSQPFGGERIVDRRLLTVLFTDVVGSTELASQLGDTAWGKLLQQHDVLVRRQLEIFKGGEVKTMGDGLLATFDSPTRAVQCAHAIRDSVRRLGLEVRAGIHTGECDIASNGDVVGLAVHMASRVQTTAKPGEILVSSTVRDVIAGSGLRLVDRGVHALRGFKERWTLFAVEP